MMDCKNCGHRIRKAGSQEYAPTGYKHWCLGIYGSQVHATSLKCTNYSLDKKECGCVKPEPKALSLEAEEKK